MLNHRSIETRVVSNALILRRSCETHFARNKINMLGSNKAQIIWMSESNYMLTISNDSQCLWNSLKLTQLLAIFWGQQKLIIEKIVFLLHHIE